MFVNRYVLAVIFALILLVVPSFSLTAVNIELANPGQAATLFFTAMAAMLGFATMMELRKYSTVPVEK
ncbi:MAG: hypothetical protein KDE09_00730 [Anaerolineales bacterium]|nr:hypothetical protein [Anaerolineales bacterium]MCB8963111.1 hypothetical protein [Ardenticatenales bacterium]MCB0005966.1 hypothetical protein [Anaerolineales bacterium]MCB0012000.1 hypothetical protein [Anaerolineales bacterium]MCB0016276.1 hypothetical protein [Anaerolineales bacterium]